MLFACKGCGATVYNLRSCEVCGRILLDPFRKCRRLLRLKEKRIMEATSEGNSGLSLGDLLACPCGPTRIRIADHGDLRSPPTCPSCGRTLRHASVIIEPPQTISSCPHLRSEAMDHAGITWRCRSCKSILSLPFVIQQIFTELDLLRASKVE